VLRLAEIASEFLPRGVFNVICGDRNTGRTIVVHATPSIVSITGSTRAGIEGAGRAARHLKRVHLEPGGRAPVMVFDDADLEAMASTVAMAGRFNQGQHWAAASRVIAGPGVCGGIVDALTEQARSVVSTHEKGPGDENALLPPVDNATQLELVAGFVDRLPGHARITTSGQRFGDHGVYYEPTVGSGLRQQDEIIQTQVFGLVIIVQQLTLLGQRAGLRARLAGLEEGLRPGDKHGALTRFRLRLDQRPHRAGRRDAARRFKHSGYGNDLSVYALEDSTRIKHVMANIGS
jgi:betaine-aldehyde dehydrogenase